MSASRIQVRKGHSDLSDESAAVLELQGQLASHDASLVLFFCSPHYDLKKLASALASSFSAPTVGCTSAGQIGVGGYAHGGITAVSLSSNELRATPYLISQLRDSSEATDVGYRAVGELVRRNSQRAFGLLLIDGLSNAEERVTAALFQALGDVPLVGGSAADDMLFRATHVYHEGEFHNGTAVFVLVDTTLPFATFKVQHVVATGLKLVVTRADAAQRRVFEIDGKAAVVAYAQKAGCAPDALDAAECARHPLLLRAGAEDFVRAVRSVNLDGSLTFACAVEEGLVFTLGNQTSAMDALRDGFAGVAARIGTPAVVLGFDCVSRRLQLEKDGQADAVGAYLSQNGVVGFCTYGEQFDSMHVAQTFSGVALGGGHD